MFWIFAVAAALLMLTLAWMNRLTFPHPWNDEVRFYLPSMTLAQHGTLEAPLLNAPEGMFWVPDGLYVWLAGPMRLMGASIEHARLVCELSVTAAVAVWAIALRRIAGSTLVGIGATFVLLTPPVILAANEVRMEAPIFLLAGIAILLHTYKQPLAAAAVLLSAVLVHPIIAISFMAYVVTTAVLKKPNQRAPEERAVGWAVYLLCGAVVLALVVEGLHVGQHLPVMREQMSYQVQRKMGRGLLPLFLRPQGFLLIVETICGLWTVTRILRFHEQQIMALLLPPISLGLGLQFAAVAGGEMNYDVYSLAAVPALFFAIGIRSYMLRECPGPNKIQQISHVPSLERAPILHKRVLQLNCLGAVREITAPRTQISRLASPSNNLHQPLP